MRESIRGVCLMDKFGINNKKILGKTVIWGILILTIIGLSFSPVWGGHSSGGTVTSTTTTLNGVTTTTLESSGGGSSDSSGECLSSSSTSSDGEQSPPGEASSSSDSSDSSVDGCEQIPEYPTAAIPGIIAAGGYLLIRRKRLS